MPAPTLGALTSLRFFAAAAIVVHHINGHFGVPKLNPSYFGQGVSFFFVLSGFILTYRYPTLPDWEARRKFLFARVARIWPAHFAALLLVFGLEPEGFAVPWSMIGHLLTNIAMVQAWIPLNWFNYSFNGPSWSISTEFGFYLLFPALIVSFCRTAWWKLIGSAGLVAALIATCNILELKQPVYHTDGLNSYGVMYLNPLARLLEFVLGMCAALTWQRVRAGRAMPLALGTALEVGALALVFLNPLIAKEIYDRVPLLHSGPATLWLAHAGAIAIPATILIAVMATQVGWISRILSFSPLMILGEISYSIYLTHYTLARLIIFNEASFAAVPKLLMLVLYVACVVGVSWSIWAFIETPARHAARRWAMTGRSPLARAPPPS